VELGTTVPIQSLRRSEANHIASVTLGTVTLLGYRDITLQAAFKDDPSRKPPIELNFSVEHWAGVPQDIRAVHKFAWGIRVSADRHEAGRKASSLVVIYFLRRAPTRIVTSPVVVQRFIERTGTPTTRKCP
jgi:hypothetical protein